MPVPNRPLALLALALPPLFVAACSGTSQSADSGVDEDGWRYVFEVDPSDWSATGRNDWFVLEPGYRLVLENERQTEKLVILVLDETKLIDNVETRVVEERETAFGELKEVSRNFFAISKRTNDVYYFGEEVDLYKKGALTGHEGTWLAGLDRARFGLLVPARPEPEARWYEEVAPDIALDRCEVKQLGQRVETPAGKFTGCLEVEETSPLEPDDRSKKFYAPGVGLVKDGSLRLIEYGKPGGTR